MNMNTHVLKSAMKCYRIDPVCVYVCVCVCVREKERETETDTETDRQTERKRQRMRDWFRTPLPWKD